MYLAASRVQTLPSQLESLFPEIPFVVSDPSKLHSSLETRAARRTSKSSPAAAHRLPLISFPRHRTESSELDIEPQAPQFHRSRVIARTTVNHQCSHGMVRRVPCYRSAARHRSQLFLRGYPEPPGFSRACRLCKGADRRLSRSHRKSMQGDTSHPG